jgi:predicted RNase H-like HicB family nuclease
MAATYEVRLERDESGSWIVTVPSVPPCHTHGRSLEQAMSRSREALSLWVDDASDATLIPDVRIPSIHRRVAARGRHARERADEALDRARAAMQAAAKELTDAGYSRRDTATLLEISHQRVQQLLESG